MGGVLVLWALVLSLAIGLRRPNFPDSLRVERGVIAISVTLVLADGDGGGAHLGKPEQERGGHDHQAAGHRNGARAGGTGTPRHAGAPTGACGTDAPGPTARQDAAPVGARGAARLQHQDADHEGGRSVDRA